MKHSQESQIEFRRKEPFKSEYPVTRGIVLHQYGGTLEQCVEKARKEFNLDYTWKLVSAEWCNHT